MQTAMELNPVFNGYTKILLLFRKRKPPVRFQEIFARSNFSTSALFLVFVKVGLYSNEFDQCMFSASKI